MLLFTIFDLTVVYRIEVHLGGIPTEFNMPYMCNFTLLALKAHFSSPVKHFSLIMRKKL